MNLTPIPTLKSITDLRYDAPSLFKVLERKKEPVFITKNNKTVGVLLSPRIFKWLWEACQDYQDQKIIDEIVESSSEKDFIDFEKFDKKIKRRLKIA